MRKLLIVALSAALLTGVSHAEDSLSPAATWVRMLACVLGNGDISVANPLGGRDTPRNVTIHPCNEYDVGIERSLWDMYRIGSHELFARGLLENVQLGPTGRVTGGRLNHSCGPFPTGPDNIAFELRAWADSHKKAECTEEIMPSPYGFKEVLKMQQEYDQKLQQEYDQKMQQEYYQKISEKTIFTRLRGLLDKGR